MTSISVFPIAAWIGVTLHELHAVDKLLRRLELGMVEIGRTLDFHILPEHAAEGDIEHLDATADSENRHVAFDSLAHKLELGVIAVLMRLIRALEALFAVAGRIDIVAAGKEQSLAPVKEL